MTARSVVVSFKRPEFAELLGLESDEGIERVTVSFSPMMGEWSLIVDLVEVIPDE